MLKNFKNLQRGFLFKINKILQQPKDNQKTAFCLIFLKTFIFFPTFATHKDSFLQQQLGDKSIFIQGFLFSNFINSFINTFSEFILWNFYIFLLNMIIVVLFFLVTSRFSIQKLITPYSYFLHFYEYFLIYSCFGALFSLQKELANFEQVYQVIGMIVLGFNIITQGILFFVIQIFYYNFSIKSKDFLARQNSIRNIFLNIFLVILLYVSIIGESLNILIIIINNLCYNVISLTDLIIRIYYYNYNTCLFAILVNIIQTWFCFAFALAYILPFDMIRDNLLLLMIAGMLFTIWTCFNYRKTLVNWIISQEHSKILNQYYMDKKIRYLVRLIDTSLVNKSDELQLAAFIEFHSVNCKNINCICKNKSKAFDSKKGVYSDETQLDFKDKIFVKHLVLEMLLMSFQTFENSKLLQKTLICYYLEIIGNLPKTNNEMNNFRNNYKNHLNIFQQSILDRLQVKMDQVLKKLNNKTENILNVEDVKKYDLLIDELTRHIFELVDFYNQFWTILCDKISNNTNLRFVCSKILSIRKIIKKIFQKTLFINENNIDILQIINFFYSKITYEPIQANFYEKKLNSVLEISKRASNEYLNLIDRNSVVIQVSLNKNNLGKIQWVSQTSEQIFGYEFKVMTSFHLSRIQPQLIAHIHDQLLENFYHKGNSQMLYHKKSLWCIDYQKKLFSITFFMKLMKQNDQISLIVYIKKQNDNRFFITNEKGEIDSFGSYFAQITKLNYNFPFIYQNVSIMYFIPSFISYFLPYFYNLKNFQIKNFEINAFKSVYMFSYFNQENNLVHLTKSLQQKTCEKEYLQILYQKMALLKFEDVENMYHIDFTYKKHQYKIDNVELIFYVWEIEKYVKLNPNKEIFQQQMILVEKLNLDKNNLYSLERYSQRIKEKQLQEDCHLDLEREQVKKTIHKDNSNNSQESQLELNDEGKLKATNIIKKLFMKDFNPGGNPIEWSERKKKWVQIVNNYNKKKNKVIGTFIEKHIEEMGKDFNKEIFFPKDKIPRSLFQQELRIDVQKENVSQSKTNHHSIINNNLEIIKDINAKIKFNRKKNLSLINIIRNIYFLTVFIMFTISVLGYFFIFSSSVIFMNEGSAQQVYYLDQLLSSFSLAFTFANFGRNYFIISDQKEPVFQGYKVIVNKDWYNYKLNYLWDSFVQNQINYMNIDQIINQESLFTYLQESSDFNFNLNQNYLTSTFDFIQKTITLISKKDYFENKQDNMQIIEKNMDSLFMKFYQQELEYDKLLNDKISQAAQMFKIFVIINVLFWVQMIILVLFLSFKILKKTNSIYELFSKIEYQQTQQYKQYFKDLIFHLKISQKLHLSNLLQEFVFKKTKSKKRVVIRELQKSNYHIYKWMFMFLVINIVLVILIFIKYNHFHNKGMILYNQFQFQKMVSFYNVEVIGFNWIASYTIKKIIEDFQYVQTDDYQRKSELFNIIYESVQQKTYFFQFETIFILDDQFRTYYNKQFNSTDNCEYLSHLGLCTDLEEQIYYSISDKIQNVETLYMISDFKNLLLYQSSIENLLSQNNFFIYFYQNTVRLISQNALNLRYSGEIRNQIQRQQDLLRRNLMLFLYYEIGINVTICLLVFFLLFQKIKKMSNRHSQFIKVIPLNIIINNQYFKIFLNKNKCQLINHFEQFFFVFNFLHFLKFLNYLFVPYTMNF